MGKEEEEESSETQTGRGREEQEKHEGVIRAILGGFPNSHFGTLPPEGSPSPVCTG